jgi:Fe2+ transport system protein FeoA
MELELKMIFNFIFRRKQYRQATAKALADLRVGERAIVRELKLDHPIAEHLMNLGFVPGLEVSVERSGPGGDPRVYRVEGTEVAMRRELSRHIQVSLVGAAAFGD